MTKSFPLFVTSSTADHKVINRFILHLRDWTYSKKDQAHLVTVRNALAIWPTEEEQWVGAEPTQFPISGSFGNAWAGVEISEVEEFLLDASSDYQGHIWMLLDDKGVEDGTVVVAEREFDYETDEVEVGMTKKFNKTRIPWDEAMITCVCLFIGKVSWCELVDEEKGVEGDRWWEYNHGNEGIVDDESKKARDETIEEWSKEGLV